MQSFSPSYYRYRPSPTNRLTALAASLAICVLIVLALIRMGMLAPGAGQRGERLTAIALHDRSAAADHRKSAVHATRAHSRPPVASSVPHPSSPQPQAPPLRLLKLTRDEFAAADISKMAKRSVENSDAGGSPGGGAAAYGPGEGPGGAHLYNAEWYREPTHAELVTYMPHRDFPAGWAMIACKTEERYHVEDCQELGESPAGSGLARALRLAAWQFLVRPPRLDGKPLIGAWVRIRFDFTHARADDGDEPKGG
jgi:protein TonB